MAITQREYAEEIESIAKSIIEDNDDLSNYRDLVYEFVDGHHWIIYTHCHLQIYVNCHTQEGEELFEDCGGMEVCNDINSAIQTVVFYQMAHDVCAEIQEMTDDS